MPAVYATHWECQWRSTVPATKLRPTSRMKLAVAQFKGTFESAHTEKSLQLIRGPLDSSRATTGQVHGP